MRSVRDPTNSGTQVAKISQASSLRLLSSRSTCLMACLGRRPRAWAKDLGQRFADERDAQRGPSHDPERRVRQRIDPFGMNILIKNAVKKSPDILKLHEAAFLSVDHIALHGRLCCRDI